MQVHRLHDVEGNASCDLDLGQGQIKIFLVNALPPKPLDIDASNFADAQAYNVEDTGQLLLLVLDLRSRSKVK